MTCVASGKNIFEWWLLDVIEVFFLPRGIASNYSSFFLMLKGKTTFSIIIYTKLRLKFIELYMCNT